jgi:hypothetical protein
MTIASLRSFVFQNANICRMNLSEIVAQLKNERSRLDAAIQALEGISGASAGGMSDGKRRGRPPGSTNKTTPAVSGPAKKRGMSAAARKRIADAMRKRWAAAKKSGKKRL